MHRALSTFICIVLISIAGNAESKKLTGRWKLSQRTIDGQELKMVAQDPGPGFSADTILKIEATKDTIKIRRSMEFRQEAKQKLGSGLPEFANEFTYRTDKTVKASPSAFGEFDATARWHGNDLVVTLAQQGKTVFVERWHVSQEGNHLFITQSSGPDVEACTAPVPVADRQNVPPVPKEKPKNCRSDSERLERYERLK
jgi:hypothetical protein